jgi:hypothetical protein
MTSIATSGYGDKGGLSISNGQGHRDHEDVGDVSVGRVVPVVVVKWLSSDEEGESGDEQPRKIHCIERYALPKFLNLKNTSKSPSV